MAKRPESSKRCLHCSHFRNGPDYLESIFKGLNCLSSGWASVRKDDGVCLEHDLYLSAGDWCDRFAPIPQQDPHSTHRSTPTRART
jgi:hypothetical protein